NLQFEDIVITEGATLWVPSGVTLRASGNITIAGRLFVENGARPGHISFTTDGEFVWPRFGEPEIGVAMTRPGTPVVTLGSATPFESGGGTGLGDRARFLFSPGRFGGGGGWLGPRV